MKNNHHTFPIILVGLLTGSFLYGCQPQSQPTTPIKPTDTTIPTTTQNDQSQSVKIAANTPFTLKVGQKGIFEANGLTIEFVGVKSDSRCPQGVNCIWQGEGTVEIKTKGFLVTTNEETSATLTTIKNEIPLGGDGGIGYSLQLVDLSPYPKAGSPTATNEYQATFKLVVSS